MSPGRISSTIINSFQADFKRMSVDSNKRMEREDTEPVVVHIAVATTSLLVRDAVAPSNIKSSSM